MGWRSNALQHVPSAADIGTDNFTEPVKRGSEPHEVEIDDLGRGLGRFMYAKPMGGEDREPLNVKVGREGVGVVKRRFPEVGYYGKH